LDVPIDPKALKKTLRDGCYCGGKYRAVGHKHDTIKQFRLECGCGHYRLVDYHDPSRLTYLLRTRCEDCDRPFGIVGAVDTEKKRETKRPRYKELYENLLARYEELKNSLRERPNELGDTRGQGTQKEAAG